MQTFGNEHRILSHPFSSTEALDLLLVLALTKLGQPTYGWVRDINAGNSRGTEILAGQSDSHTNSREQFETTVLNTLTSFGEKLESLAAKVDRGAISSA